MLQRAFAKLSNSETKAIPIRSLQQCFSLAFESSIEAPGMPKCFPALLAHVGPSMVELFFVAENKEVSWVEFVRGYIKCCGRMSASISLKTLFRVFTATLTEVGGTVNLKLVTEDIDGKLSGGFMASHVLMLLWMCWIMSMNSKNLDLFKETNLCLPDINNLLFSAVMSCTDGSINSCLEDQNILAMEIQLQAEKLCMWAMKTVPHLPNCFTQFVNARLQKFATLEEVLESSSLSKSTISLTEDGNTCLLTHGMAWAIALTLGSPLSENILNACFSDNGDKLDENLLYRSSLHGKGLNRFWSHVEGYHGPLMMLISGSSDESDNVGIKVQKWIIGALTQQGFENKDLFYGTSGSLYAISPIFDVFSPSGKEKNFVYSHLHPTGKLYEANPKPVGIGFGGTLGNERIFIDEDFARVSLRHHAVDKTYQPGSLIPNQGFLAFEASILEVEVWGLGGKAAKEQQVSYKNREQLFTEQRRQVDLKTFASWDDSPEKMMMGMVSDPNKVQREER